MSAYERVEESRGIKYIRAKSGRVVWFFDALRDAKGAHTRLRRAVSRAFKLADNEYDLERLEWFVDDLARHTAAIRQEIEKRRGVKTQEERIALLRNTAGRTPEEAAEFHRKADELERRLHDAR